jgi:spore germination cell wall hydrolase CwlJ-like protein
MLLRGKLLSVAGGAAALSGTLMVPSSNLYASPAPQPAAIEVETPQAVHAQAPTPAQPAEAVEAPAAPAPAVAPAPEAAPEAPRRPRRTASSDIDSELECLAKVVLHEAGNQSRTGQIAVAEVVMNRLRSPRFPKTICGVVLQRGQFFNVHAYRPYRDARWPRAVEIAREVRDGEAPRVTNGAFFFRAHYGAGFPGRTRVATIGGHAFYR